MPMAFGENFWLFLSLLSDGLGFYLLLIGCHYPLSWPLLVPITWAVFVCCLFGTPPFLLDMTAVVLLHFLSSHFAAHLNCILLSVLIFNALPFLSYLITYLLDPEGMVLPRIRTPQYLTIVCSHISCIRGLCQEWESQDGIREMQSSIRISLLITGTHFLFAHALDFLGGPRHLRREADEDIMIEFE